MGANIGEAMFCACGRLSKLNSGVTGEGVPIVVESEESLRTS